MTDNFVTSLLQWLNANPELAGLVTFTISAAESVAIIGTIIPGTITMTAIGALAGAGIIPLWQTIIWAILGAIVGDGISYWIGHYFKERLPKVWPFRNHPSLLRSGEIFFHKYGGMSVFIGRFVGPVRALVPLVAGMLGMKPMRFLLANVTSAIGWAPAYMLPGILVGAASTELPPEIAVHVILALLLIGLFISLCLWLIYRLFKLAHNQIEQIQTWIWQGLKNRSYLSPITSVLSHHDESKAHGQLNLAIYFLITSMCFVALALYVRHVGASHLMVNDALFHFFRSVRTDKLDDIAIDITLLGQKQVILPVIVIIFGWLCYAKNWRAAAHTLGLGVLAAGSVFVIKNLICSVRPLGIAQSPETYSMPSGHTTLSATVFFGLAFLITLSVRPGRRWPLYVLAGVASLLVALSRLYLGAHWFTDIIAAWLLSATVLLLIIISYERQPSSNQVNPLAVILLTLFTLSVTFPVYRYLHLDQMKSQYQQVNSPSIAISMNDYWHSNDALPAYRASLFGFPSQDINIQWSGQIDDIRTVLLAEGWTRPPARDLISTLHRIADISSAQYLPLISPQYQDKKPELVLTRTIKNGRGLLVIRLWSANRTIKESGEPVWVGIVGAVPRSYSWLFRSRAVNLEINPALVFPSRVDSTSWEWKVINKNEASGKNPENPATQKILLIRSAKSSYETR
jgi:membrane protein DedA with SNARE-associated domain/membrane-associated phospholipid phosphatase